MTFPKDFLWGASTSSHQIEGSLSNDWTEWEKNVLSKNLGAGLQPILQSLFKDSNTPENYISSSKFSPESYKYWRKDVEVIKEMGLKVYRLSVEWSRIVPEEGVFSTEGIKYYVDLLKELKKNDIKVVLTCWHWTLPLWLAEKGGLLNRDVPKYFREYVSYLYEHLHPYVDYWLTINEPESFFSSYFQGIWPPGKKNILLYHKVVSKVLPKMHIEAYKVLKSFDENLKVSFAKNYSYISPYNNAFYNKLVAKVVDSYVNYSFVERVKKYMDFIGLNFYFHRKVSISGVKNTNDKVSDLGWWLEPDKLYYVIKSLYKRYKLPIIITENGLADSRDKYRSWWIEESIKAIYKAIEDGYNVFGYCHWSLLDNFEWDKGYWPKFGLVSIDPETKDRNIKPSGRFYSKIIKENGII